MRLVTIRMGAAEWSAEFRDPDGVLPPAKFNFREMSQKHRNVFHAEFMGAYRRAHPYQPRRATHG